MVVFNMFNLQNEHTKLARNFDPKAIQNFRYQRVCVFPALVNDLKENIVKMLRKFPPD